MRTLIAILALALTAVACGSDEPLAGSDLPLAEAPTSVEPGLLALPFRVDLPAGYWSEGAHRYRFVIDRSRSDVKPVQFAKLRKQANRIIGNIGLVQI